MFNLHDHLIYFVHICLKNDQLNILKSSFDWQTELCILDTFYSDFANFTYRICCSRLQFRLVGCPPILLNSSIKSDGLETRRGLKAPVISRYCDISTLFLMLSSSNLIFSSSMSISLQNFLHKKS